MLPLCRMVPRQVFGDSYFTAPVLVLLRLVVPAQSLQLQCKHVKVVKSLQSAISFVPDSKTCSPAPTHERPQCDQQTNKFSYLGTRYSTVDFCHHIRASSEAKHHQIVAITWVKALRSNMSHEFIQFVVQDLKTDQRYRLISDRHENGDWVFATKAEQTVDKLSWLKSNPYKGRHNAPLPLISLTFDDPGTRPSLQQMVTLLAEITTRNPDYSPVREMCWWYAEKVIESARSKWPQARLKEWAGAKYRYTFVIFNDWIRRKKLASHADEFESFCLRDMMY